MLKTTSPTRPQYQIQISPTRPQYQIQQELQEVLKFPIEKF